MRKRSSRTSTKSSPKKATRTSSRRTGRQKRIAEARIKKSSSIQEIDTSRIPLDQFAAKSLKHYGQYVVMERAVQDMRDGLKPVHRYILWAMKELGLWNTSRYLKSARTVGDVIGKYHPHGDQAAYDSMVTLANTKPNLVEGQGNWGSPVDGAAAMRYTESKIGAFAQVFLLDKDYLKTIPTVDNFDGEFQLPVYLPATLPVISIIGGGGIAFGLSTEQPPFALDGVYRMILSGLKARAKSDRKLNVAACCKFLEIDYPWGCRMVSPDEDFKQLMATGKGSIKFVPHIVADWKNKVIDIKSYAPGFRSDKGVAKKLEQLNALDKVSRAGDDSGEKNPKSGPFGAYYYVKPNRGISEDDFYDLAEKVEKILTGSVSYDLGFTIRSEDKDHKFYQSNFPAMFNNWITYRIGLEHQMIKVLLEEQQAAIDKLELLIFAIDHRQAIIKCLDSKDPDTALSRSLKISMEKAKAILNLQVRKLAKLEKAPLVAKVKEHKAEIKKLKADDKNPIPRIIRVTQEQYARYKKMIGEK